MNLLSQVIINGLGTGATYALAAVGISLIFGVLNIINFGHGAAYTWGAFLAFLLFHSLGLNFIVAFALAVGGAAAVGYLVERLTIRPLRSAPLLMPLITTLGAGIFLEDLVRLFFGPATQPFPSPIPSGPLHIGGTTVTIWEVVTLVCAVVAVGFLQVFLHRTDFGKAVRAVAEDRRMAALLGIDVDRVIIVTFCLASALGGLAGILSAALYNSIYPVMGSASLLKAFAASVLGGMEVISGAVLGGFLLGIVEAISSVYISSAWTDGIALAVLVLVLVFKPTGLLGHRQLEKVERTGLADLPIPPIPTLAGRRPMLWLTVAAASLVPVLIPNAYVLRVFTMMALYGTLALSLNIVAGFAGIISLAHAAFFGVGAYASALLATRLGMSFWVAFPISALLTGLAGAAFAWPVMRLRGHYVAMGTLGLGGLISIVILNWTELTRGPMGIRAIPVPRVFAGDINGGGYYYLILAILLVSTVVVVRTMDSPYGRALKAMRDDQLGVATLGIDVRYLKMMAYALAAAIAGAVGSFWAHFATFISPDSFSIMASINILAMVVIGGLGSVPGTLIGGALLAGLPEALRFAADFRQVVYGLLMICVVLFRPQGLLGFQFSRVRRRRPAGASGGRIAALEDRSPAVPEGKP